MTSKKTNGAADIKSLQNENKAALTAKFPRAKLVKQFELMAKATGSEAEATQAKRDTAFIVCELAGKYRIDAFGSGKGQTEDVGTILDSWREHWKGLIAELHAAQSPFVELGEANKKGERKPVMTNYGRNVASTARGVIEFDVSARDEDGKARPYTEMTKDIVTERRENLPEQKQTINAAKAELADAMTILRKQLGQVPAMYLSMASVILYCSETVDEHGSEGLIALTLALDELELDEFFPETEEDEESEVTVPVDDTTQPVEIATA